MIIDWLKYNVYDNKMWSVNVLTILKFWTHHTQWCGDTSDISTFCSFLIMMVWNYFYNCFLHSNDTQILIISTILTRLHFSFFGDLTAKFIIFKLYMSLHAKNALNTIFTNNSTVTISCQKIGFAFWITLSRDIITMSQCNVQWTFRSIFWT